MVQELFKHDLQSMIPPMPICQNFLLLITAILENGFVKFNIEDYVSILKALCNVLHVEFFAGTWLHGTHPKS